MIATVITTALLMTTSSLTLNLVRPKTSSSLASASNAKIPIERESDLVVAMLTRTTLVRCYGDADVNTNATNDRRSDNDNNCNCQCRKQVSEREIKHKGSSAR